MYADYLLISMADDRRRHEGGEYKETVSPESALDVVKHVEKPFVTAGDVADALDCSRQTALRKLSDLDGEEGPLKREDVGARASVWWLPD
jgi:prophage antirepressor-like protein